MVEEEDSVSVKDDNADDDTRSVKSTPDPKNVAPEAGTLNNAGKSQFCIIRILTNRSSTWMIMAAMLLVAVQQMCPKNLRGQRQHANPLPHQPVATS